MKLSTAQQSLLLRLSTEEITATNSSFRWANGERVHSMTIDRLYKMGLLEADGPGFDPQTGTGGWHTWTWVRLSAKGQSVAKVKNPLAVELGRRGGLKGGKARAAVLTPEERSEIARKAAQTRWARLSVEKGGKG